MTAGKAIAIALGVAAAVIALAAVVAFEEYPIAHQISDLIDFVGRQVDKVSGWPLVTLLCVVVLLMSGTFRTFLDRVSSFSAMGISAQFSEAGKRALLKNAHELTKVTEGYREELNTQVRGLVSAKGLRDKLSALFRGVEKEFSGGKLPKDFRCCIHVQDPIYENRLYQLTDYVGGENNGFGRSWHLGYGIIGRVWRSGESVIEGDLIDQRWRSAAARGAEPSYESDKIAIVLTWGCSLQEAEKMCRTPSYLAVLVEHRGRRCIVFADSTQKFAFQNAADNDSPKERALIELIASNATKLGIGEAVDDILTSLEDVSPRVVLER